jgi:hypothetical protein
MSEKNLYENEDPLWQIHMQTLMRRKRSMEIAQIIDDALLEYYSEKGVDVPRWKSPKNPQWWIDYLNSQGLDENNEPI